MNNRILNVSLALVLAFVSSALLAQEKSQSYYYTHDTEILPDARKAFSEGNYERAVVLCTWHYIIVGDNAANDVLEKAERCNQLLKELGDLTAEGKEEQAHNKADELLKLNPDDPAAKRFLLESESEKDKIAVDTVSIVPAVMDDDNGQITDAFGDVNPSPVPKPKYRTRFLIKAGVSAFDISQLAQSITPGGALGLYDIAGSRIGTEVGGFFCPGLSNVSVSFVGLDAGLVLRVAKGIYPKLGMGFFSCKPTDESAAATLGLSAGAGLTFLIGGHFCIELGAKYYPVVKVAGTETVTTAGASYEFPVLREIISGGIAPELRVGWAF